ncbi:LptF/LptG family permease [Candidatus Babeliales bacterium]|nr:LptF/LptG family permease [Candidatus Babeliales bacterium]
MFFVGLLWVLGFGDLLIRLTVLPSLASIPKIILLMLPLVSSLAIPLAACLAVCIFLGKLHEENVIVMLSFIPSIRKQLFRAVLLFALVLAIPYSYIVFEWAPKNYFKGKQFILTLAKDKLSQLEPGVFHNLMSKGIIYFKNKEYSEGAHKDICYKQILLMYRSGKAKYIATAQEGFLKGDSLLLKNGTLETCSNQKNYIATFETTEINIDEVLHNDFLSNIEDREAKFLTWKQLINHEYKKKSVVAELHSRIGQVLWLILLPLLSFFGVFALGRLGSNNLLLCVALSSFNFLSFYIGVALSKAASSDLVLMQIVLYGVPLGLFLVWLLFFKKRRVL